MYKEEPHHGPQGEGSGREICGVRAEQVSEVPEIQSN
jgi:hypothetical protein